jgi:hypothetical protein
MAPIDRFNTKWMPEPYSGCWLWIAAVDWQGYRVIGDGYKTRGAHRVAWLLFRGEIPEGMRVCHKCDTPLCVNPGHLFLGTQKDNMQDAHKKGRAFRTTGELHHFAKLTNEDIFNIRSSSKSRTVLAEEFGVCVQNIGLIQRGQRWAHIWAK